MYKYPYGDSQQLNLDWILAKLKELEQQSGSGGADLEEVSNALIALTYNPATLYTRYDYAFHNGKLYRCLTGTSGTFDPDAWQEALIGDDLAVLTRWINAIDAAAVVDVKFDTTGTNGKLQQKYHDQYHDVVEVDYTPVQNSKRPLSSNAGYELNGALTSLENAHLLTNLDKEEIIKYSDGRIQLKYFDGTAQYIITFNPSNKSITQSKSDDGITFTDQWSINNNVAPIVPIMASQNDYTLDHLTCDTVGSLAQINCAFTCVSPYTASPGILIASGLPAPPNDIYFSVPTRGNKELSARIRLANTGELYIRYGYANLSYDVFFTYIKQ